MQSNAYKRLLILAIVLASTAPHVVFAGHEELVQQHRLMRAALSGASYLPGDPDLVNATQASPSPHDETTVIIAAHTCDAPEHRNCVNGANNP